MMHQYKQEQEGEGMIKVVGIILADVERAI